MSQSLRDERESRCVSMSVLARVLGVSVPELSDIERGRRCPDPVVAAKIREFMEDVRECGFSDIFNGSADGLHDGVLLPVMSGTGKIIINMDCGIAPGVARNTFVRLVRSGYTPEEIAGRIRLVSRDDPDLPKRIYGMVESAWRERMDEYWKSLDTPPYDYSMLRKFAEKATKGPWEMRSDPFCGNHVMSVDERDWNTPVSKVAETRNSDDARFIAACDPQVVLRMIERMERMQELLYPEQVREMNACRMADILK